MWDVNFSLKKYYFKRFKNYNHLNHRGPDSNGFYKNENVKLIHTRLSIVDLHGGADQLKTKLVLIANGEIYNDLLLEKNKKYSYKTKSDSESVLAVYKSLG